MKLKHPNLFVMIPRSARDKVSDYFDLDIVGEWELTKTHYLK